jgi:hypothetical protein
MLTQFWKENWKEGRLSIGGEFIIIIIIIIDLKEKKVAVYKLESSDSGQGLVAGEHDDEHAGSINCWEYFN